MKRHQDWAKRLAKTVRDAFDDSALWPRLESAADSWAQPSWSGNVDPPPVEVAPDLLRKLEDYKILIGFDRSAKRSYLSPFGEAIIRLSKAGLKLDTVDDDLSSSNGSSHEDPLGLYKMTDSGKLTILTLITPIGQETARELEGIVVSAFKSHASYVFEHAVRKTATFQELALQTPDPGLKNELPADSEKVIMIWIADRPESSSQDHTKQ